MSVTVESYRNLSFKNPKYVRILSSGTRHIPSPITENFTIISDYGTPVPLAPNRIINFNHTYLGLPKCNGGNYPKEFTPTSTPVVSKIELPDGFLHHISSMDAWGKKDEMLVDLRLPPVPVNFKAVLGEKPGVVNFTWEDTSDMEVAFHLLVEKKIDGKFIRAALIRIDGNTEEWSKTFEPCECRLCLRAANEFDGVVRKSEFTPWITLVIPDPISAPTEFKAVDDGNKSVLFSWHDNSTTEVAFHILVEKMVGGYFQKMPYIRVTSSTGPQVGAVSHRCLMDSAGYYRFAVRSASSDPNGIAKSMPTPWTNILISGEFPIPQMPEEFIGSVNASSLVLAWKDTSDNETIFHIRIEKEDTKGVFSNPFVLRAPPNTGKINYQTERGTYRVSIRSAYSTGPIVRVSAYTAYVILTIP